MKESIIHFTNVMKEKYSRTTANVYRLLQIRPTERCRATWLSREKRCTRFRSKNENFCRYHAQKRELDWDEYHLQDQLDEFRRKKGLMLTHRPILIENLKFCQDSGMTDAETTGYLAIIERDMRIVYQRRYGYYRDYGHDQWMERLRKLYDPYFHTPHGRIVKRPLAETESILETQSWIPTAPPTEEDELRQDEAGNDSWTNEPLSSQDEEWDQVEIEKEMEKDNKNGKHNKEE